MQLSGSRGSWARRAAIVGGLLCFAVTARGQSLSITGGNPGNLRIMTAIAGQAPTSVSSAPISYRVAGKNNRTYKITARLSGAMPPGVTLQVMMTAPTGAVALGPVTLDATTRDVVSNIVNKNQETETITYTLSATVDAGVVPPGSRIVTFTLVETP